MLFLCSIFPLSNWLVNLVYITQSRFFYFCPYIWAIYTVAFFIWINVIRLKVNIFSHLFSIQYFLWSMLIYTALVHSLQLLNDNTIMWLYNLPFFSALYIISNFLWYQMCSRLYRTLFITLVAMCNASFLLVFAWCIKSLFHLLFLALLSFVT